MLTLPYSNAEIAASFGAEMFVKVDAPRDTSSPSRKKTLPPSESLLSPVKLQLAKTKFLLLCTSSEAPADSAKLFANVLIWKNELVTFTRATIEATPRSKLDRACMGTHT